MDFSELFNDSFQRNVVLRGDAFFEHFYNEFLQTSPVIRKMFVAIDMDKQRLMLRQSLTMMIPFAAFPRTSDYLVNVARVHADIGISEVMFDAWMDALVRTLEKHDSRYRPEEGLAWRIVLAPVIVFMKCYPALEDQMRHPEASTPLHR